MVKAVKNLLLLILPGGPNNSIKRDQEDYQKILAFMIIMICDFRPLIWIVKTTNIMQFLYKFHRRAISKLN